MQDRFIKTGLEVHRWPASTPADLTYPFGSNLSPGQMACSQSHVLLWKHIMDNNLPYAFILEDDACFDRNWREKLNQFCDQNTDTLWDAIFLNASESIQPAHTWTKAHEQYLTGGYIVSLRGAQELYNNYKDRVWGPDWMTSRQQLRGHCYSYFPWLIIQEGDESTIGSGVAEDHAKVLRLLNEIQYPLTNYHILTPLRIGVIIPTYKGHLHLLKRCLDCIQAQTRKPDIVAISVSSVQLADVKQIELSFNTYTFPIRLIFTDKIQYAAANRNRTIELIIDEVDIIVCQDSDDEMYPYRLEYTERAFQETNCDFVGSSYTVLLSEFASVAPSLTDYKAYPEALIADPGNPNAPRWDPNIRIIPPPPAYWFHPYYIHDMLIPSGSVLGLIVKPEIQSESRDIHHGQMAFTSNVWKCHQFSELEEDRRREDSIFGRKISLLGFKGTYISTPLVRYHCYDK